MDNLIKRKEVVSMVLAVRPTMTRGTVENLIHRHLKRGTLKPFERMVESGKLQERVYDRDVVTQWIMTLKFNKPRTK